MTNETYEKLDEVAREFLELSLRNPDEWFAGQACNLLRQLNDADKIENEFQSNKARREMEAAISKEKNDQTIKIEEMKTNASKEIESMRGTTMLEVEDKRAEQATNVEGLKGTNMLNVENKRFEQAIKVEKMRGETSREIESMRDSTMLEAENIKRTTALSVEEERNTISYKRMWLEIAKIVVPTVIPMIAYGVYQKKVLEFEENGKITSTPGRGMHLPKFWK